MKYRARQAAKEKAMQPPQSTPVPSGIQPQAMTPSSLGTSLSSPLSTPVSTQRPLKKQKESDDSPWNGSNDPFNS